MQHRAVADRLMDCRVALLGHALHEFTHSLDGAAPVKCGPRPVVQQVSDGVQFLLAINRQVRALGQELAQRPVGVLTAAALSGAVRVAEVHAHVGVAGQLAGAGHLMSLVVSQRLVQRSGATWRRGRPGLTRRLRPACAPATPKASCAPPASLRMTFCSHP